MAKNNVLAESFVVFPHLLSVNRFSRRGLTMEQVSSAAYMPDAVHEDLPANTPALIGTILTAVAGVMCVWLFLSAGNLQFQQLASSESGNEVTTERAAGVADRVNEQPGTRPKTPIVRGRPMRLLLLGSTAAVLNLTGLSLSVAGLVIPDRRRILALISTILSFLLFAGVFGVLVVGILLDSLPAPENPASA